MIIASMHNSLLLQKWHQKQRFDFLWWPKVWKGFISWTTFGFSIRCEMHHLAHERYHSLYFFAALNALCSVVLCLTMGLVYDNFVVSMSIKNQSQHAFLMLSNEWPIAWLCTSHDFDFFEEFSPVCLIATSGIVHVSLFPLIIERILLGCISLTIGLVVWLSIAGCFYVNQESIQNALLFLSDEWPSIWLQLSFIVVICYWVFIRRIMARARSTLLGVRF